jgi:hypothetical protein
VLTCIPIPQGALRALSPTYFHKILKILLMYLVSLSQPQNAASVLELSRSLEFEHEVRREVTFQVKHWFGQVDDADERWEMVDRWSLKRWCVKSAYSASVQGWFQQAFFFFPALIPRLTQTFVSGRYLLAE